MKKLFYILFTTLILASCQKDECTDCVFDPVVPTTAKRVYLHYIAMDNNLSSWADRNINDMLRGVTKKSLNGGIIYVFRDMPDQNSQLISIFWDEDNNRAQKVVVKTYDTNLDASSTETLRRVISDVDDLVDAPSWALGFGSHGMGWIPVEAYYQTPQSRMVEETGSPLTRFLIYDGPTGKMEYDAFARAIRDAMPDDLDKNEDPTDKNYDFILMDMCYMGGVEFAYEFRNAADYMILSPSEVIAKGMPYDLIIGDIFDDDVRRGTENVCRKYYEYYDNYDQGQQFATISLVDCAHFEPFIEVMKEVVYNKESEIKGINIDALTPWCFDGLKKHITFDLRKFVQLLGGHNGFETALTRLLPYRETTGKPLIDTDKTIFISKENYCGISTYIPSAKYDVTTGDYPSLNEYYDLTGWAQAIYPEKN